MAETVDNPVFKPPNPVSDDVFKPPVDPVAVKVEPELPPPLTESVPPADVYFLEIMKNGSIIERINITKNRISFGRSREADVPLDHPSISRYHAVILWKGIENTDRGYFYLLDLNSTHGSVLNKNKVDSGKIVKIPIGNNVIKFGGSSRSIMVNSSIANDEDRNDEINQNVVSEPKHVDTGCGWGMREDAKDEDGNDEEGEEAFMEKFTALLNAPSNEPSPNEHAFAEHPQRTLQIWFDQEGYEFEFQTVPEGSNFKATLQLPIEGRDVAIDGPTLSRKKDAITQLCIKVCRLLDRAERLFPWQHQNSHKRARAKIEEDEEEDLYDETEQSKLKKARKQLLEAKVIEKQVGVETFESLQLKYEEWSKELAEAEGHLALISQPIQKSSESINQEAKDDIDPLDQFMESELVKQEDMSKRMDIKIEKSRLKMKIRELQKKMSNCEKLMVIAKPTHIPLFSSVSKLSSSSSAKCISNITSPPKEEQIEQTTNEAISVISQPVQSSPSTSKFQMKIVPKSLSSSKLFSEPDSTSKSTKPAIERLQTDVPEPESIKKNVAPSQVSNLGVGASLKQMKQKAIIASDEAHEDFIDWVPPKNQDGSGKTSLNEKFGY